MGFLRIQFLVIILFLMVLIPSGYGEIESSSKTQSSNNPNLRDESDKGGLSDEQMEKLREIIQEIIDEARENVEEDLTEWAEQKIINFTKEECSACSPKDDSTNNSEEGNSNGTESFGFTEEMLAQTLVFIVGAGVVSVTIAKREVVAKMFKGLGKN